MLRFVILLCVFCVCLSSLKCFCLADIVLFIGEDKDAEVFGEYEGVYSQPYSQFSTNRFGAIGAHHESENVFAIHYRPLTEKELFGDTTQLAGVVSFDGNIVPVADSLTHVDSINLAIWDFERRSGALQASIEMGSRKAEQLSKMKLRR